MSPLLSLQLIISFLVGGIFIALQTLIAERVPSFWRGIVLTVPTTMALAFFFVGLVKTPTDVVDVARILPAALAPDYLFVAAFALSIRFGFFRALVFSSFVFFGFASLIFFFPPASFVSSIFLYGFPFVFVAYFFVRNASSDVHLKPFSMNFRHILIRSLIGGTIIMMIVFFSKTFGNVLGGIFSGFPAAFSSTLIIYYFFQGSHVIPAVAKSFFFPGSVGFVLYALIAAWSFPLYGIWTGTLLGYIGVFLFFWLYSKINFWYIIRCSKAG